MANRITEIFKQKNKNILSIYFTAGYPSLNDTVSLIETIAHSGADMIEIGMPFSDPLADGPVIQASSMTAIHNGMTIPVLFEQIKDIRAKTNIPLILMGYMNPVLQYGVEKFAEKAASIGIDGVILPDLPLQEYIEEYKSTFEKFNLKNIFLITPQTSNERVKLIDAQTDGFIYMVSSASTTGTKEGTSDEQIGYFERINSLNLKNPRIIGFGIKDNKSFNKACEYANGAIIGTAFIKALDTPKDARLAAKEFIQSVLN
ncbi:MAG: tryptophan synthase subunit alpha [Bacteroidetes bacterium]|nr:MAG: tryptophan synthase subunit alpha [Bacteroidota bacterium]